MPTLTHLFALCRQIFQYDAPPEDLARRVLAAAATALECPWGAVLLLGGDDRAPVSVALGDPPHSVIGLHCADESLASWAMQQRRLLLSGDAPPALRRTLEHDGIGDALAAPCVAVGWPVGVVCLARRPGALPLDDEEVSFVALLAERLALAMQMSPLPAPDDHREPMVADVLESIPSSLVVFSRSLRIVAANRNFLEKARRTGTDTLGRSIEDVLPRVLVDYTQLRQKVREVLRTGQPSPGGRVSYRAPGLAPRIYYYRLVPLGPRGSAPGNVMLLMDDVTDQVRLSEDVRRAERHLSSVVECASDLVVSMDAGGHIVTWNRAAETISGLSADRVAGRAFPTLCDPEQRRLAEGMLHAADDTGIRRGEVGLLTADGTQVPIAWSCAPMLDDDGAVSGIVAVGRDLTEQRRLETQLLQSVKMASLGVMAGGIAHELRNPLGIISANAQLLAERPGDAERSAQCVQKITAATRRASLIIENLLRFARPSGEQMRVVYIDEVLRETLALLAEHLAARQVTVRQSLRPRLPPVYGNPELLQQVFTNIMLNACNAMSRGGSLLITTRSGGGIVEIRFEDSGHGIAPQHLGHIFDPFFTTMPVGQGTGLGLAVSYSIVQQHGGTIEATSPGAHGATFSVRLPTLATSRRQSGTALTP
jgi:PAS domain S-box-containing protein